MVKSFFKYIFYFFLFLMALIFFAPKINLYYLMEKYIAKYDVVISNEKLKDKFFDLNIKDMEINVKGVKSATIANGDILLTLFYNKVNFDKIQLSSAMQPFFPINIKNISIFYTIFDPLHINGEANGEFGEAKLKISLLDRKISVFIKPSKLMIRNYKNSLREIGLKKLKNGEYKYEENF